MKNDPTSHTTDAAPPVAPKRKRGGRPRIVLPPDFMTVSFRLPTADVKAIDRFAAKINAERPGLVVTRTDALRVLYLRSLIEEGILQAPAPEASEQPVPAAKRPSRCTPLSEVRPIYADSFEVELNTPVKK